MSLTRGDFLRALGGSAALAAGGCRMFESDADVLARIRANCVDELYGRIAPFWAEHSVDRAYGGFITCLERDGRPYDTFKQMWMQWRSVWMFARLSQGRHGERGYLPLAEQGFDFLFSHGRKPDGGYWYMLNRQGDPIDDSDGGQEVFTESFAAIGCAELYRATGKEAYRREAESAYRVYRAKTARAEAAAPAFPAKVPYVQLAYPMIGLNVLQSMRQAFGGGYEREIDESIRRMRRFTHPESKLIFERAPAKGGFDLDTQYGRFVNPGHALEGCVFIQRRLREKPDAELLAYMREETMRMLDFGWDDELGGIYYCADALGKPMVRNDCVLKAWWPQCEAMTAALGAYELTRDGRFLDRYRQIDDYCTAHLRDPEHPEWFAYASTDGRQWHSYKGSRFKGFFHIPRCLCDCIEICERIT